MSEQFSRLKSTTHEQFQRDLTAKVMRARKILRLLESRGRISFGNSGDDFSWKIPYREAALESFEDLEAATISRQDRFKTARLPWRSLRTSDAMGILEKAKNKGEEAIITYANQMVTQLMTDAQQQFQDQCWASGSGTTWHGIESLYGTQPAVPASGGFVGAATGTYGELNIAPGSHGGNWFDGASVWPKGRGDVQFDFWAPMIVDTTDTAWASATKTWVGGTAIECISFAITNQGRNRDSEMDLILLERQMLADLKTILRTEERLTVIRGKDESSSGSYGVGFNDVINVDGVDVTKEYGIASGVGYGMCIDEMELQSLFDDLFMMDGPTYHQPTQADLLLIYMAGNFKFKSPRYFPKFANLTSP